MVEDPALVDVGKQSRVSQLDFLVEKTKEWVAFMYAPVQPAGWGVLRRDSLGGGECFRRHRVTFEKQQWIVLRPWRE